MAKILLVEDDNNLREIYEARMQAEGYTVVSAMDGEAALVVAKQEKPDLIISDVMMARISGFEMLDILRNTDGLKHVKVIMLTALGQAEDRARADNLGADRYLVKSQVTLEDIVKSAQELLAEAGVSTPTSDTPTPAASTDAAPTTSAPAASTTPPAPAIPTTPTPAAPVVNSVPTPPAVSPVVPAANTPTPVTPAAPSSATLPPAPAAPAAPPSSTTNQSAPAPQPPVATSPPEQPTPAAPPASQAPVAPAVPASTATDQPAASQATSQSEAVPPVPSSPAPNPTPEPTPPPAPATTDPEPTGVPAPAEAEKNSGPDAQSTSDEQAAVEAQIKSFISEKAPQANKTPDITAVPSTPQPQNTQPTLVTPSASPAPVSNPNESNAFMSDAIKGLVSNTNTPAPEPNAPTVITPAEPAPSLAPEPASTSVSADDSSVVARKKVIKPLSHPEDRAPNLDELLAKEGFTGLDDDESHAPAPQSAAVMPAPGQPAPTAVSPQAPALPTTPHPPGHVISPSGGGVDPNTIAL